MNKIYKVVNNANGSSVASELAKGHGKKALAVALTVALTSLSMGGAYAVVITNNSIVTNVEDSTFGGDPTVIYNNTKTGEVNGYLAITDQTTDFTLNNFGKVQNILFEYPTPGNIEIINNGVISHVPYQVYDYAIEYEGDSTAGQLTNFALTNNETINGGIRILELNAQNASFSNSGTIHTDANGISITTNSDPTQNNHFTFRNTGTISTNGSSVLVGKFLHTGSTDIVNEGTISGNITINFADPSNPITLTNNFSNAGDITSDRVSIAGLSDFRNEQNATLSAKEEFRINTGQVWVGKDFNFENHGTITTTSDISNIQINHNCYNPTLTDKPQLNITNGKTGVIALNGIGVISTNGDLTFVNDGKLTTTKNFRFDNTNQALGNKGVMNITNNGEWHVKASNYGSAPSLSSTDNPNINFTNTGVFTADTDMLLDSTSLYGDPTHQGVTFTNSGKMVGYLNHSDQIPLIFKNELGTRADTGVYLRNWDRSQAGSTQQDLLWTFTGGTFDNAGNVFVMTDTQTDPNAVSNAELAEVQFTNQSAGVIDLSKEAPNVGDHLTIANTTNPALVTNGGTLVLDSVVTTIDESTGAFISESDLLTVDSLGGTGKTTVKINGHNKTGYKEDLTPTGEHGIKIIESRDQNANALDHFQLGQVVASGLYEYTLVDDGVGNIYLNNTRLAPQPQPQPPQIPPMVTPPQQPPVVTPQPAPQALYNPFVTNYLGNQRMAADMFSHSFLDRKTSGAQNAGIYRTLWARTDYHAMKAETFNSQHEIKGKTNLLQMGMDLVQTADVNAGLFTGYGYSDTKVKSKVTASKTEGKVKGYMVGAYATYAPEATGLYVDTWAYYGNYKNELKDKIANAQKAKYDSSGFAISAEAGYALPVAQTDSGALVVEPHAQVSYHYLDTDKFNDGNTLYSDNKTRGVETRVGARVYQQTAGVSPFVEVNYLYNGLDNKVKVNGRDTEADFGKNVGEAKIGLAGQVNDNISVWGNVAGRAGSDDYRDYGVQLGVGVRW